MWASGNLDWAILPMHLKIDVLFVSVVGFQLGEKSVRTNADTYQIHTLFKYGMRLFVSQPSVFQLS
jgi:hypothetical protein